MATIRALRGRWQAMVRRKGMAPRAKSFDKKNVAERWARELEVELDRCGALPDTRVAESMTLNQLLTRYRDEVSPKKRSGASEANRINGILRRPICYRTLTLLSSQDVATYRDERLKEAAPATVIRELTLLSHALDTAQKEWGIYLPRNPVKMVRRPTRPNGRTRRLALGEEGRLLEAAGESRNAFMHPIIILAIETGMRRGELLNLSWRYMNFESRTVHLPHTKNGFSRDVPLSVRATKQLLVLRDAAKGERVFETTASAVQQAWERLVIRVGMEGLRFHDLRHEAISRLFEKGLGVAEVSAISGHREFRMLQRYTHLRAADLVARIG
jgi:integrase